MWMAKLDFTSKGHKVLHRLLNTCFLFLLSFYFTTHLHSSTPHFFDQSKGSEILNKLKDDNCHGLHNYQNYKAKCEYVISEKRCHSLGYIHYLQLFYCTCGPYQIMGYTLLILWLVLLFYVLGDTATNYFCYSLECFSRILKLSPAIAGVTLLSLGNGAPDVFASMASNLGEGMGEVGLNSILGGAFFVSNIVVGIICVFVSPNQISIDRFGFIRDVLFLLVSLCSLLVIEIVGKINLWGAMAFVSLYFSYVFIVSTTHFCRKNREVNLIPVSPPNKLDELSVPLLGHINDENTVSIKKGGIEDGNEKGSTSCLYPLSCSYFGIILYILELPLYLPRRLTIPVVSEKMWSKPFAVISVTLAPILLSTLWNSQNGNMGFEANLVVYVTGGLAGATFGILAFVTTQKSSLPKKYLIPWAAGGFLMSIIWTYIIAKELIASLVSLGTILGLNPSILGLTVLACGNSLGDLIANIAMTMNGGPDGVQVAISACYAGPIFNTLMGLGLPLVFSCWSEYPSSYAIPTDPFLYETLGFLMSVLLWALIILPNKDMKLDRFLGGGLLTIYLCFLSLRLARTLGLV